MDEKPFEEMYGEQQTWFERKRMNRGYADYEENLERRMMVNITWRRAAWNCLLSEAFRGREMSRGIGRPDAA